MYRFPVAVAVLATAALLAPAALADQPTRQPLPFSSFTIRGSCTFDVLLEPVANKEVLTTFTNGMQIISGRLVVRLTNVSNPSKSVLVQVSGPGIEDLSNPSVFNLSGTSLVFFPGTLLLTRGPVSLTFDEAGNLTFAQTSASSVDLCAVLADP
jgi:hypothetical protein